ncbi:MAG: tetratricopeptide repeat protein [Candidatus Hodarchaeota archaeon]
MQRCAGIVIPWFLPIIFTLIIFANTAYGESYLQEKDIKTPLQEIGINLDFVEIQAISGVVSIYGAVKSKELNKKVNGKITKYKNVVKIFNNLIVYPGLDTKCGAGYLDKAKDSAITSLLKATLKKEKVLGHLKGFNSINLFTCGGQVFIIGRCYDPDVKNEVLNIVKESKGVTDLIDLIYCEKKDSIINYTSPEYSIFSLSKTVEMEDSSLFKKCFSEGSINAYEQMVSCNVGEALRESELDDLFRRLMKGYKNPREVRISHKNGTEVEVNFPFFKNIDSDKYTFVKVHNDWKIDIVDKLEKAYPAFVEACIKHSEKNYNFKKLEGNPEKVKPYLITAIKYDPKSYKAHNYLGMLLLAEGKYHGARDEFIKSLELNKGYFYPYYNLAKIYAKKQKYEDTLCWLKKAVRCDDFREDNIDVSADFTDHPVILYALPEDMKDLGYKTNQMFELREDAFEIQRKLNELFYFTENPSDEISEARRVLEQGNLEAAYINYMRHLSHHQKLTDENLDQLLEALTIWKLAYVTRICQISLSMYDTGGKKVVDDKLLEMVHPSRREVLKTIALSPPPAVVSAYKGKFSNILKSAEAANHPENITSTNIGFICVGGLGGGFVGGFGAGAYLYKKYEAKQEAIYNLLLSLPPFKITEWKEATIDYTVQNSKYKECMKILDNLIQREKGAGILSSSSLTKLAKSKELLEHYYIYIDKIYRAFLFDSPMKLNLVNLRLQFTYAKGFLNDDESKIQEVGRQYSKLTPILRYVALDNTHRQWENLAKTIKKELSENEFNELKQESKTLPNWFVEIN